MPLKLFISLFIAFLFNLPFAFALPQVSSSDSNAVSITTPQSNPNELDIALKTNNAVINFSSYDLAQNETINYTAPAGTNFNVLNNVTGSLASVIAGRIDAIGINLYLVNPNGIRFTPTAQINVSSLIASSLSISAQNFQNGIYQFTHDTKTPYAQVLNQGQINASGSVALIGSAVANTGAIVARAGSVHLASGDATTVSFDEAGLVQVDITAATSGKVFDLSSGKVIKDAVANPGTINGHYVVMAAKTASDIFENAVNQTGVVNATSSVNENGVIKFIAQGAPIQVSGTVNAGAGGTVLVNSDKAISINAPLTLTGIATFNSADSININANSVVSGSLNLNAPHVGGTGVISGDTLQVTANDFLIKSLSANTGITLSIGNLTIDQLSQSGDLITMEGVDFGSVTYADQATLTLDANAVSTAPGIVLQGQAVIIKANQFGSYAVPLAIHSANITIQRLTGDLDIAQAQGLNSNILITGPPSTGPPSNFGAILYNSDANIVYSANNIIFTSAYQAPSGSIELLATNDALISGMINVANDKPGQTGGTIIISGNKVVLFAGTVLDASGDAGGGTILIGGNYHGAGPVPNATDTYVDPNAFIFANAITTGNGGQVAVWSNGITDFYGYIIAEGGALSGNGGYVETSGEAHLNAQGYVDLTAPNGIKGNYLLDPSSIEIYGNVNPSFAATDGSINLGSSLQLWLDASNAASIQLTYNLVTTLSSDSGGDNVIPVNDITNLQVGERIQIGGSTSHLASVNDASNIYTITGISGNNVTLDASPGVVPNGTTIYGGYVSQISDLSTNGNNASVGGAAPIWISNGLNNLGTIQYNGSNYFTGTISNFNGGSVYQIFAVENFTGGATFPDYNEVFSLNAGGGENVIAGNPGSTSYLLAYGGAVSTVNGQSASDGAPLLSLQIVGTSGTNLPDQFYVIGTNVNWGGRSWVGNIPELIIYQNALSNNAQALLNQYDSGKWNVALVPSGSGGTEAAKAMASDGYSVFTDTYLERLSQTANINLSATGAVTIDLQGDNMALAAGKSISITAGTTTAASDITFISPGTITTQGGNITLTPGSSGSIVLEGASAVTLASYGGNVVLNGPLSLTSPLTIKSNNNVLNNPITVQSGSLVLDAPTDTLNVPITLAGGATLSGTATTVNVGSGGLVQNGVDAAAAGGSVYLADTTYNLSSEITIGKNLSLDGNGAILNGQNATRVMEIDGTGGGITVNLSYLTMENGNGSGANESGWGGGLLVYAESGNQATVNISNSTISSNSASGVGGGIENDSQGDGNAIMTINNSAILNNLATGGYGGGIENDGRFLGNSTLTINDSTIADNTASNGGGAGVSNDAFGGDTILTINNSTISGNSGSINVGGICNCNGAGGSATMTIGNMILDGNTLNGFESDLNNGGVINDNGYNLFGSAGGYTGIAAGDINYAGIISNVLNTTLANNGGLTQTLALVASGPAVGNGGSNTGGYEIDQRGYARDLSGNIDIGAYEYSTPGNPFKVTSISDTAGKNIGQLRTAFIYANNNSYFDPTITFDSAGLFSTQQTIALGLDQLTVSSSLTLNGTSAGVTLNANNATRVMEIDGSSSGITVNLNNLTFENGTAQASGNDANNGGALLIYSQSGNHVKVNINNSTLTANTAVLGGAIYNDGSNSGDAVLTINNSTITGNLASNSAGNGYGGGAIYNYGQSSGHASLIINNGTISVNTATTYYGGILNDGAGGTASVTIGDTILGGNADSNGEADYYSNGGTLADSSYNLYGQNGSGGGFTVNGAKDILLSGDISTALYTVMGVPTLLNNGGPTQTIPLVIGSPAYLAGGTLGVVTSDQRGVSRGSTISIGAFDYYPTSLVVNSTIDNNIIGNAMTLRDALYYTNIGLFTNPTITFDSGVFASLQTITLDGSNLAISTSLSLQGPSAGVILDANNASRVMEIDGTAGGITVNLSNLTLEHGIDNYIPAFLLYSYGGAGLLVYTSGSYATVNVNDSAFINNTAFNGAGISNFCNGSSCNAIMTINNSTIANNTIIDDSNSDPQLGSGIFNFGNATLAINNSTIAGNSSALPYSGAVTSYNNGSGSTTVTINNSTITGNTDIVAGAGLVAAGGAQIILSDSIVAGNTSGGIESDFYGSTGGTITSNGYNLFFSDQSNGPGPWDLLVLGDDISSILYTVNGVPTLADNGGPTQTIALVSGSPALGAGGPNIGGNELDQRGVARDTGRISIGASENLALTGYAISGTVYTQPNSMSLVPGDSVKLLLNGTAVGYTLVSNASGEYFYNVPLTAHEPLLVYLDSNNDHGGTVTLAASSPANISSLDIYQNNLTIRYEDAGPITNGKIHNAAGSVNDPYIPYTYLNSGSTLTVNSGIQLYSPGGYTYNPGGNVILNGGADFNGPVVMGGASNFKIQDNNNDNITFGGTFDAAGGASRTITVSTSGTISFDGVVGGLSSFPNLILMTDMSPVVNSTIAVAHKLTFEPVTSGTTMGIGSNASGNLKVSDVAISDITAGSFTFGSGITGALDINIAQTIGAPATFITNGTDVITLDHNLTTSAGASFYAPVIVNSSCTVHDNNAGDIIFGSPINDASSGVHSLTVNTGGTVSFDDIIGGTTPLNALNVTGTTININGNITTAGVGSSFNGPVYVSNATNNPIISDTNSGNILFSSTIDDASANSDSLTVQTSGPITFDGALGGINQFSGLSVLSDTTPTIVSTIAVTGNVNFATYTSGTSMGVGSGASASSQTMDISDAVMANITAGSLTFGSGTTGAMDVNTAQNFVMPITFQNNGNGITLDSNLTTQAGVTFDNAVAVKGNYTVYDNNNGNITFNSTIDEANMTSVDTLTLRTGGTITFGDSIGNNMPLDGLSLLINTTPIVASTINAAGNVSFAPYTSGTSMGVGSAAAQTLNITDSIINSISSGSLTFGSNTTGAMDINASSTFAEPVTFKNGSGHDITVDGVITSSAAGNAVVIASGNNFVNNYTSLGLSANPISMIGGGNWVIYSTQDSLDTHGAATLNPSNTVYGTSYNGTVPAYGENTWVYSTKNLLDHFVFAAIPSQTAGGSFTVQITAEDVNNHITNYDTNGNVLGAVNVTFSSTATASPNSTNPTYNGVNIASGQTLTNVPITFTNGVATTSNIVLTHAGETPSFTMSYQNKTGVSNAVTINPATASQLIFGTVPSSSVTAGATWNSFTVKILDQYGNLTASTDNITVAPSLGSFASGTISKAALSGVATFNDLTYAAGATISVLASDTTNGGVTPTPASAVVITANNVTGNLPGNNSPTVPPDLIKQIIRPVLAPLQFIVGETLAAADEMPLSSLPMIETMTTSSRPNLGHGGSGENINNFAESTKDIFLSFTWTPQPKNLLVTTAVYSISTGEKIMEYQMPLASMQEKATVKLTMPQGQSFPAGSYEVRITSGNNVLGKGTFSVSGN